MMWIVFIAIMDAQIMSFMCVCTDKNAYNWESKNDEKLHRSFIRIPMELLIIVNFYLFNSLFYKNIVYKNTEDENKYLKH